MLNAKPSDRALPTFITLLVIGVLLMTFDVRLAGGGVVGVLRTGTQEIVSPLQRVAAFVVTPIANALDSLSNVASLREQNAALKAELAEAQADLVAVQDDLAKLGLLEKIYDLETDGAELGQTVANVIGSVDAALIVDKGTRDGILVGQPVIDTNGYVVGTVKSASMGSATILPITATSTREGLTVLVGSQTGTLVSRPFSSELALEMDLDVFDAREPVLRGDRVLTSAASTDYPAGLPVGEVLEDASPESTSLSTTVRPFVDADALRFVVILAWPPDPVTAATDDTVPEDTTGTTLAEEATSTTSTTLGSDGG
jgi:rod shape-determining protein MreC